MRISEAERRQAVQDIRSSEDIVIELLRNARDARASQIFVASSREGDTRSFTVVDDGDGIPPSMHRRVFDSRVTSKLDTSHLDKWGIHGRGMALFSISENAELAIVQDSLPGLGASIRVLTDLKKVGERKDQSTLPRFIKGEGSEVAIRGPRNIARCCFEFAIEARNSCRVRLGSPTEIAAALYAYGCASLSELDRMFCSDPAKLPLAKRLATAQDPADFAVIAAGLGLEISQRSARRILDGDIDPAFDLLEAVVIESAGGSEKPKAAARRSNAAFGPSPSFDQIDIDSLKRSTMRAFAGFAGRYYLSDDVEPSVRVERGRMVVSVPLVVSDDAS
ncbi:MAG: ATP-binding protein [Berryella intestinalis]|uniref:ATP-binding protein n=1 Tax=Berryella intestinalis TaxID=1531429 RepID=UPI002A4E623B|nr:ATP-binding protein [Berryella intestinalis]MDD7369101.1 ATP-binding protein [Berryella intestinalis]MDY3128960.1 ATP-binding protein [Berryella intestinalis]